MLKTKYIALAAIAAFVILPVTASADDSTSVVSYSAKKQGRVVFQKTTQDEATSAQDMTNETNVSDIEPAAGGFEPEDVSKDDLAKSMNLPRK